MKRFFNSIKELLLEKRLTLLILGGVIGLLSYFIVYMVEDMNIAALQEIFNMWPEDLLEFFGDVAMIVNPYGFWALEMLSFIWAYAGIYIVYMASSLLSQEVEEKTIDLSLSKPVSRYNFLGAKIVFVYLFILASMGIFFLITMGAMAASSVYKGEGLFFDRLWGTYIVVVLFLGALAMFAKFFSTIFLRTRRAMAFGVMVLFLMFFLGEFYTYMDESIQNVKYISIFYYFNPGDYLVYGDFEIYLRDLVVLGSFNAVLIVSSLLVFNKKDIPI